MTLPTCSMFIVRSVAKLCVLWVKRVTEPENKWDQVRPVSSQHKRFVLLLWFDTIFATGTRCSSTSPVQQQLSGEFWQDLHVNEPRISEGCLSCKKRKVAALIVSFLLIRWKKCVLKRFRHFLKDKSRNWETIWWTRHNRIQYSAFFFRVLINWFNLQF